MHIPATVHTPNPPNLNHLGSGQWCTGVGFRVQGLGGSGRGWYLPHPSDAPDQVFDVPEALLALNLTPELKPRPPRL